MLRKIKWEMRAMDMGQGRLLREVVRDLKDVRRGAVCYLRDVGI